MSHDEELDERVARAMRAIRREEPSDDRAVDAIVERVRQRPRPRRRPRRAAGMASVALLAAAAVVAIAVLAPRMARPTDGARTPSAVARAADAQPVRFSLDAPGVRNVSVVGDFSNWRPVALRRVDGSARWTVTLPIAAGRYTYVFVVDGARWVADPAAPVAPDADFGTSGSVLVVERGRTGGAS